MHRAGSPQRHTAMVARRASVAVSSCHPHRGSLGRGWRRSAPSYPFGLSRRVLIISCQYFRSNSITRSRDA